MATVTPLLAALAAPTAAGTALPAGPLSSTRCPFQRGLAVAARHQGCSLSTSELAGSPSFSPLPHVTPTHTREVREGGTCMVTVD
eukprot:1574525-Pyramimonas_sp.AAC.1